MPYQRAPRPPMTDELARQCERAVHVITPEGRVLRAGRASLYAMDAVGWRRFAALFSLPPLSWLVERVYAFVAAHRGWLSRVFFRSESD